MVALKMLCRCEIFMLNAKEGQRVDIKDIKFMKSICSVRKIDRMRYSMIKRKCEIN